MYSGNDKKGFNAKKWKSENTAPGGGIVQGGKGMRYDDHSNAARRVEERRHQSEQKNNPGSSISKG
ncbi:MULTISPECIES: hypothetical protein [Wolbachia]|uniref:Uncharacterized protein n=1 Tax=Wolbachia pipientis TaxID=955 RepID=A0A7G5CCF4_WOLPI|nr:MULTISPECIES: hypothetical protein [Wolbachia]MDE5060652.1 hypothetical protein [Wolbachia endosymbiont of Drosophila nikananu]QMV46888.1 hypothetical protein HC356_02095 [Wolbachia pipientis]